MAILLSTTLAEPRGGVHIMYYMITLGPSRIGVGFHRLENPKITILLTHGPRVK
jgi:hypothetical protein